MSRPVSLWKSYGIQQLPGNTPSNNFLRNTHGGGNERIEGMSMYMPDWGFMNRFNGGAPEGKPGGTPKGVPGGPPGGNTGGAPGGSLGYSRIRVDHDQAYLPGGAAVQKTGYPHVYMRNDYDHSSLMSTLRPITRSYHPGTVATQAAASRHRLNQRYMGSGIYDWGHDTRTDAGVSHVAPTSDFGYNYMERESDAMLRQQQQQYWREAESARMNYSPQNTVEATYANGGQVETSLPGYASQGFQVSNDSETHNPSDFDEDVYRRRHRYPADTTVIVIPLDLYSLFKFFGIALLGIVVILIIKMACKTQ